MAAAAATEKIARQKLTWRHLMVLITCCLCILGPMGITYTCAGLCYKPVSEFLGVQVSDISFYITCVYLANGVFAIPMATVFRKFNSKIVITLCCLAVAIPIFCMSFYTAPWMWWVSGWFMGAGLVCITYIMPTTILGRWFHTQYGLTIGLTYAMTGVSGVIFNLIGQFVLGADLSGWRELYQLYGVAVFLLSVPFSLLFLRDRPQDVDLLPFGMPLHGDVEEEIQETKTDLPGYKFKEVFKMPFFWALLLAGGLLCLMTTQIQMFAPYVQWLGHTGWGGFALVGLLLLSGTLEAFCAGGQAAGKVLIGAIESRSLRGAIIIGCAGGIVGLFLMWQMPQLFGEAGVWPMFFGGAIFGLCYALSTAMTPFITREVFGEFDYERIYSVVLVTFNLIGACGATGWAIVMQTVGWDWYFIGGMINVVIIFILLFYIATAGYKARAKTWYKSDAEIAEED